MFFGGGTPSILPTDDLASLLNQLAGRYSIHPGAEVTVEANPGTVDGKILREYQSLGINRLSIGVQSFHDDDLRFLTRIHSADEARRCVTDALNAGFENVSIDLIFSLPQQTKERWLANLEQAIALNPTHLSCYSLIVEADTPLVRMVSSKQVSLLSRQQFQKVAVSPGFLSHFFNGQPIFRG